MRSVDRERTGKTVTERNNQARKYEEGKEINHRRKA